MNLIAIEASTETLSLAVSQRGEVRELEMAGGPNASANLLPSLQKLMAEIQMSWSQIDAVAWGRGPGSFTGLRTACAVAQGIGFAHDLPLLGVDTLAACAQQASRCMKMQSRSHHGAWVVAVDARMNEIYLARYAEGAWRQPSAGEFELIAPHDLKLQNSDLLCGNAHRAYPELAAAASDAVFAVPTAGAILELAPELIALGVHCAAEQAVPLYVRNKVAQTTAEREAARPRA